MFRRKRNSSQPPLNPNPSSSAQTAAAQAFRASQSNTDLSSSAAATALRTHASPTPSIKDVQTKRMVRRQLSSSSIGSAKGSLRRGSNNAGLQRSRSSGSMAGRTFRDQSSICATPTTRPDDIVPVPPLPRNYTASQHRRTASLEPSYRAIAPPSRRAGANPTRTSLDSFSELERRDSRGSINFSYPMGARPNSPPQSPVLGVVTDMSRPEPNRTSKLTSKPSDASKAAVKKKKGVVSDAHAHPPGATKQTSNVKRKPSTIPEIQEDDYHQNITKQQSRGKPPTINKRTVTKQAFPVRPPQRSSDTRDNRDTSKSRLPETQSTIHSRTNSVSKAVRDGRPHSLSPNRLTRFSGHLEIPNSDGHLHEPPPRSMSPAKSALKTTALSPISHSDRQWGRPIDAPSETSDGTSVVSDDGSRVEWKKKIAKVSFGDDTEIVGHVQSPPTSPESCMPDSPQSKGPIRPPWHGYVGRNQKVECEDEFEEVMRPRPTLPSFGSVRGYRQSSKDNTETISRNLNSSGTVSPTNITTVNHSLSTDGAIGEILSGSGSRSPLDQYPKHSDHPLPQEAAIVDSTGYSSSSGDSTASDEGADLRFFPPRFDKESLDSKSKMVDVKAESGQEQQTKQQNGQTPAIFVQPATPALGEKQFGDEISPSLPSHPDITNNTWENQSEDSDSGTGNSIYSDAVEDPSELDGDGFGSINAIVDSPTSQSFNLVTCESSNHFRPDKAYEIGSENQTGESLDSNSASWLQQSQQSQQLGVAQETHTDQRSTPVTRSGELEGNQLLERPEATTHSNSQVANGRPDTTSQDARYSAVGTVTKPSTPGIHQENSNNANARRSINGNKVREPVNQSTHSNQTALMRTLSQGSDSSSSFKRAKPSRPSGHFFSKRTMRGAPSDARDTFSDAGGRADPTFDHTSRRRPFSSGDSNSRMRLTMRQIGQPTHSKASSISGFRKFTKPKAVSERNRSSGAGFRSRYDESSDDEPEIIDLRPVRGIPRRKNEIDGDSTDLDDSSENEIHRNSLRRPRLNKNSTKVNRNPQVAAAVADVMAAKRAENTATASPDDVHKELEHFLPRYTENPKWGIFDRLGLSRRSRRQETRVHKSGLDSPARRDTPLERSRLELENSRKYHPPNNVTTPSTVTTVNNTTVTETTPHQWQKLSPKLQKRNNKSSSKNGSDSWPLHANGAPVQQQDMIEPNGRRSLNSGVQQNGTNHNYRPHTSDGVVKNGKFQTKPDLMNNTTPTTSGNNKPAWTSRFLSRHTRRETRYENPLESSASDVGPSMGTAVLKQRERRGKFPIFKKVFGLSSP